jgi:hypothetical protein
MDENAMAYAESLSNEMKAAGEAYKNVCKE